MTSDVDPDLLLTDPQNLMITDPDPDPHHWLRLTCYLMNITMQELIGQTDKCERFN